MVKYFRLKVGSKLHEAIEIKEHELLQILNGDGMDSEHSLFEIDNGKVMEIQGYNIFTEGPRYGICVKLDTRRNKNYIQIIENLDANYLMHEKRCEAVVNCIEYAYQIIELHKFMGRYDKDISITEVKI